MFITDPLLAELGVPGSSGPATKRPLLAKVAFLLNFKGITY